MSHLTSVPLLFLAFVSFVVPGFAGDNGASLFRAKSLKCTFESGNVGQWKDGVPKEA